MLAAHHGVIAKNVPHTISATATLARKNLPLRAACLGPATAAYSSVAGVAGSRAVTGRSVRVRISS